MKTIIAIALIAAFTWSWASKNETAFDAPEDMTLGDCFQGEGGAWFCR